MALKTWFLEEMLGFYKQVLTEYLHFLKVAAKQHCLSFVFSRQRGNSVLAELSQQTLHTVRSSYLYCTDWGRPLLRPHPKVLDYHTLSSFSHILNYYLTAAE